MTTNVILTTGWTSLALPAQDYLLTNRGPALIELAVTSTGSPPTVAHGHLVAPSQQVARYGNAGPFPPGYTYARVAAIDTSDATYCALDTWLSDAAPAETYELFDSAGDRLLDSESSVLRVIG